MAKIISLTNQKGGVAKTTSSFNIGVCLAQKGFKTLLVDLDPQASLTIYSGLEPYDYEKSIVDVLKYPKQDINECIISLREKLDIISSRIELAGIENELLSRTARELILSKALEKVKEIYDYIVIDCPPQLSTLTINALAASDGVVIPCKTDYLSYRGIAQLYETIETIKSYFKPDIKVLGVLATFFETRSKDDKDILEVLKEEYNVIGVIKRTVKAKQGIYDGKASVEQSPKSEIAKEYEKIVKLLFK